MQELQGIKRKLVDALAEMGTGNRAMNDAAVERACHIAKALSDIATFEVMEESGNSGNRGERSYGMSYGNDWQHGGDYREQTSRDGASRGGSYNGSYDGRSYADREAERRELEMRLEQLKREDMRR